MLKQCSKLRGHPAPGVHNLAAGCTHFDTCAAGECTLFQSIPIHSSGNTEKSPGAQFCVPRHPLGAQDKCLISNTVKM